MRGLRLIALVCAGLFVLTSCGRSDSVLVPDPVSDIVRVGYTDSAPDYVLAKLFERALKSRGVPARLDRIESSSLESGARNVGPTVTRTGSAGHRAKLTAVATGVVDVVPEDSGQLLLAMNPDANIVRPGVSPRESVVDSEFDAVFTEMTRSLPQQVRSLKPAPADRAVVLAVRTKDDRVRQYQTISQLSDGCGRFNMVVHAYPSDAVELEKYAKVLRDNYRCSPKNVRTSATASRDADIMVAFGTDPALLSGDWRILKDDQAIIPTALMFPLVAKSAVNRPRQLILEELAELITTGDVQEMQRVEYQTPTELDAFLKNWLRKKGYVGLGN